MTTGGTHGGFILKVAVTRASRGTFGSTTARVGVRERMWERCEMLRVGVLDECRRMLFVDPWFIRKGAEEAWKEATWAERSRMARLWAGRS
jgi:hypothetical protein